MTKEQISIQFGVANPWNVHTHDLFQDWLMGSTENMLHDTIHVALFRIAEQNDKQLASKDHNGDYAAQVDRLTYIATDRV